MMDIQEIIDLYYQRKAEKEEALMDFYTGERKFIVIQKVPGEQFGECNTLERIYATNIDYFEKSLLNPWSDEVPYLEPWIGTGVYANAFGCPYKWLEDNAPHPYYRYHSIEELRAVEYPDYHKSPIMNMVLDCIDYLKEKTCGKLPICLTDTQSPSDTATLIVDASEFFIGCYQQEEIIAEFMGKITDLIIEFSNVQAKRIGRDLHVKPGHIMPSSTAYRGLSISDDNLAVASPWINEKLAFPFDQKLADAFNGLAVHSCGKWARTMEKLKNLENILMVDCALSIVCDPTPNKAAEVRDALKGSGIIVKARLGNDLQEIRSTLADLFDPSLKLIVEPAYTPEDAERNYHAVYDQLNELYQAAKIPT
ncbi:MAG: uroporphyrinogen decarboxylase family protein [Omnitrophica WOR_2 bacterium]